MAFIFGINNRINKHQTVYSSFQRGIHGAMSLVTKQESRLVLIMLKFSLPSSEASDFYLSRGYEQMSNIKIHH